MSQNTEREVIFRVQGLQQWFPIKKGMMKKTVGHVKAVDNITLDIYKGESLAIVGESGSGKSVFTKTFAGMLDSNGFINCGNIIFSDDELADTTVMMNNSAWNWVRYATSKLNE